MSDSYGPESADAGDRAALWWIGPLWIATLVLAAVAAAVLVISDSPRLLRLGLIAALWGALMAAFATVRLRSRISGDNDRIADLQRIYELELEREVAARREFELEAENEARRRVAEESASEIQTLRSELQGLRQKFEQLVSGDVLFERLALRAESARMRSFTERSAMNTRVAADDQRFAGATDQSVEPATRLIGRLSAQPLPPPQRPHRSPQASQHDRYWFSGADRTRSVPTRSPGHAAAADAPSPPRQGWSGRTDVGAHTQGTSVTELLAAHGVTDTGRRRRRPE